MLTNDLQRETMKTDTVEFLLTFGVHMFTNAITILPRQDISYLTFSLRPQISKPSALRNKREQVIYK